MFGLFKKDFVEQLKKEYQVVMEEVMYIQCFGDLKVYVCKIEVVECILVEIEILKVKKL